MAIAFAPLPLPAPRELISPAERRALEAFVAAAIDLLDAIDGDPDLEDDDPCGVADEDGYNTAFPIEMWPGQLGPGCPLTEGAI